MVKTSLVQTLEFRFHVALKNFQHFQRKVFWFKKSRNWFFYV